MSRHPDAFIAQLMAFGGLEEPTDGCKSVKTRPRRRSAYKGGAETQFG